MNEEKINALDEALASDKTNQKEVVHGGISMGNDYKIIDYLQALGKR